MRLKILMVLFLLLSGCAVNTHPIVDWISFGKKCITNDDGVTVTSYLWFYNRKQGLDASKNDCEKTYLNYDLIYHTPE